MNPPEASQTRVLQLRLVVRADDYDETVRFYRDVLGAQQELQLHSEEGQHVTILDMGRATLEISNRRQVELIDDFEVGAHVSPPLRGAVEVVDADEVTSSLVDAGAKLLAPPTRTPWGSLNARTGRPRGIQLTVFQESIPT